jgi:hypothetical protein
MTILLPKLQVLLLMFLAWRFAIRDPFVGARDYLDVGWQGGLEGVQEPFSNVIVGIGC